MHIDLRWLIFSWIFLTFDKASELRFDVYVSKEQILYCLKVTG